MREHDDPPEATEPEGTGWVEAPRTWVQPLITVTLCRYTGLPYVASGVCLEREALQHPDENCWEQYHSASALIANLVLDLPEDVAIEVRAGSDGPIGTTP